MTSSIISKKNHSQLIKNINGLGATPLTEQYIFANDIRRLCELEGLDIRFVKVGTHLTSLDM